MIATSEQVRKVLTGGQTFSQLGFSMMITRMRSTYSKTPSAELLKKCTDEINLFFEKFEAVLAQEYAIISKL